MKGEEIGNGCKVCTVGRLKPIYELPHRSVHPETAKPQHAGAYNPRQEPPAPRIVGLACDRCHIGYAAKDWGMTLLQSVERRSEDFPKKEPGATACIRCHAPLTEHQFAPPSVVEKYSLDLNQPQSFVTPELARRIGYCQEDGLIAWVRNAPAETSP